MDHAMLNTVKNYQTEKYDEEISLVRNFAKSSMQAQTAKKRKSSLENEFRQNFQQ